MNDTILRVLFFIFHLSLSPLEMCCKLKALTIRDEIVPLPEAGAPSITALNIFRADGIVGCTEHDSHLKTNKT